MDGPQSEGLHSIDTYDVSTCYPNLLYPSLLLKFAISLVVRTMVNCSQITMIWWAADPNFVTTPAFILGLGTVACVFGMLDIMIDVWLFWERVYERPGH